RATHLARARAAAELVRVRGRWNVRGRPRLMLPQPVIVGVLGAAAVVCFVLGLWLPLADAERRIARRLQGFVQAPIAAGDAHLVLRRPRGHEARPVPRGSSPLRFLERILAEAESTLSPGQLLVTMSVVGLIALAARTF